MPDEGLIDLPGGWVRIAYETDDEAYVHFHINHSHPDTHGNSGLYQKLTPKTALAIADALRRAAQDAIVASEGDAAPISDGAVCG